MTIAVSEKSTEMVIDDAHDVFYQRSLSLICSVEFLGSVALLGRMLSRVLLSFLVIGFTPVVFFDNP